MKRERVKDKEEMDYSLADCAGERGWAGGGPR